jgi:DNA-binding transcriptional MerR regulator
MIYDAISGNYGDEIRGAMQEMYDDVVNDSGYRLHPDDDFEKIIEIVVDQLVDDSEDYKLDEISDIKRLAGQEEVDEGFKSAAAGIALLIAAGIASNKLEAEHLMKTEPQLITLAQMRQEAFVQNDEEKVKELDDRIEDTKDHISVTGRPVMGIDGLPVDPRQPVGEAEYQGRKVPLGKPMQGDVAKSKVYVKNAKGNVVKVNFGDKNMTIKKNNPARRKSFRARHNCDNPGPRWKARYWSCRAW